MNDPLETLRITVDDFNTLDKDILVLNCKAFQKKLIELQSSLTQALAEKETLRATLASIGDDAADFGPVLDENKRLKATLAKVVEALNKITWMGNDECVAGVTGSCKECGCYSCIAEMAIVVVEGKTGLSKGEA